MWASYLALHIQVVRKVMHNFTNSFMNLPPPPPPGKANHKTNVWRVYSIHIDVIIYSRWMKWPVIRDKGEKTEYLENIFDKNKEVWLFRPFI